MIETFYKAENRKIMYKELLSNFEKNGFKAILVKNKADALTQAQKYLKEGASVGFGGSVSVEQIGVFEYLKSRTDLKQYNQYEEGIDMQENSKRRRLGILADVFLTSCNAVSKEGFLINADGSGNRVAAITYGAKQVVLVIGKNKIVDNLDAGIERLEKVAAVKNVERLNQKAAKFGKPQNHSLDKVLCKYSFIKKDLENRINIILVDEELGF